MPFYSYSAQDATGKWVEGTLHAASAEEARRALAAQRLLVQRLGERGSLAPATPAVAPRPAPVAAPAPVPATAPATAPVVIKTGRGSAKERFFLFSQLHSYAKSGMNPRTALEDLAGRTQHPGYAGSLREAAAATGEGFRLSDSLERYPRLYPPDVIGTLRAGESAGFMPEALEEIARQTGDSIGFGRKFLWLGCSTLPVLFVAPLVVVGVFSATRSMKIQNDSNFTVGAGSALGQSFGAVVQQNLLVLLAFYFLLAAGIWFARSDLIAELRHRVALFLPPLSGRARSEGLGRFTWAMGLASRSGVSPREAWSLAAATIPNRALRARLMGIGNRMRESARLSPALRETGVVPDSMASIVETGEMTGDVPGALDTVARMFAAENQSHGNKAAIIATMVVTPLLAVMVAVMLFLMYREYFNGLMDAILGDT